MRWSLSESHLIHGLSSSSHTYYVNIYTLFKIVSLRAAQDIVQQNFLRKKAPLIVHNKFTKCQIEIVIK